VVEVSPVVVIPARQMLKCVAMGHENFLVHPSPSPAMRILPNYTFSAVHAVTQSSPSLE
jgi:hypothetical protein